MRKFYFSIYELTVLSLLGALAAVLQIVLRIPLQVPGHTGVYLVVPLIIGIAIVQKPLAGTYMGLIFGVLSAFNGGGGHNPTFEVFIRYFAMGIALDVFALPFKGYLDNIFVGVILGCAANLSKFAVNYVFGSLVGIPMSFLVLGLGAACMFHIVFGGIGGALSR
jgi:uncharacterized membrane protein